MHAFPNTLTIFEIAETVPGDEIADLLRVNIARDAVSRPSWCERYTDLLTFHAGGVRHPETFPYLPSDTLASLLLGAGPDLQPALEDLTGIAARMGAVSGTPDLTDAVAALVATECWLAATKRKGFSSAASMGPDAVASAAAILARASGNGVQLMPLDPEEYDYEFGHIEQTGALRRGRTFSNSLLGESEWTTVIIRVLTDLGWGATSRSRTQQCSILLSRGMDSTAN